MKLEELLDAWRANNAVNLELLAMCQDEDLELKPGKGKTIRSNFVHIVAVRRMHLEEKMRKEADTIPKLDWKTASREEIICALGLTHDLMVSAFVKMDASARQTRWTVPMFFAYCIAHEAHHRSQIDIALRINGREPEESALYGLWDWTKK